MWEDEQKTSIVKGQETKRKSDNKDMRTLTARDTKKRAQADICKKKSCTEVSEIQDALEKFTHLTTRLKKNIEHNTKK